MLAPTGERLFCNQEVLGSSPRCSTNTVSSAWLEHLVYTQGVRGSNPLPCTSLRSSTDEQRSSKPPVMGSNPI